MMQPDKWEPVYYCAFCDALDCKADNVDKAAKIFKSKLETVFSLLDNDAEADHRQAIAKIACDFFPGLYYNFTEKMSELGETRNNLGIEGYRTYEYLSCGNDIYDIITIIAQQLTRYENEVFLSDQKLFLKKLGVDVLFDMLEGASGSLREELIKRINEDQAEIAAHDPDYKVRSIPPVKKLEIQPEDLLFVVDDKENDVLTVKTASYGEYSLSSERYKAFMKVYEDRKARKAIAYILWFFLGCFGLHRFYVGDFKKGLLFLLTLGLCGFGWFIDVFFIGSRVDEYNEQQMKEMLISAIKKENSG